MDSSFFITKLSHRNPVSEPDRNLLHETGDSAADAVSPSRCPARLRAFQWPPSCIPSKWGDNGKPTADMARPIAYRYAEGPPLRSAFLDQPLECPLDFRKRSRERRAARVKHDVPLRAHSGAILSERLAQPALDSIAHHRASDGAWNRESQPRTAALPRTRSRQAERREHASGKADAVVINRSEIGGAQDSGRLRESQRAAGGRISWLSRGERLSRH